MKRLIFITLLLFCSASIVITLFFLSQAGQPANGFKRKWPEQFDSAIFKPTDSLELPPDYYISGSAGDSIFLGSRQTSALYFLNWNTHSLVHIPLTVEGLEQPLRFLVSAPHIYSTSPVNSRLLVTKIQSADPPKLVSDQRVIADFIPIEKNKVVIKTWNMERSELELGLVYNEKSILNPKILEKQIDGKFCTDGKLLFNRMLSGVIYVYYYRNQWMFVDTTLTLIKRYPTIDTVSHARISVSPIKSEHSESLSSPARITNQFMTTSDSMLLIQSLLKADNENSTIVKNYSAVDVYHLPDGKYIGSFYIPYSKGDALREFYLMGKILIVRYRKLLVIGRLPEHILDHEQ